MNLSDFPLGELFLGQIQAFIYYLTQRYIGTIVGHVYLACIQRSNVSTRFPHYPIISQSLFAPLTQDALSLLSLLLASGRLHRRGSYPNHRKPLVRGKSLQ